MKRKLGAVVAYSIGAAILFIFYVYGPLQTHIKDWLGW